MSSFTAVAARLAGLVPAVLGWRPDEFWTATPAEVAAILAPQTPAGAVQGLGRGELNQLLERDHG
ncbi:phage tail assembly chaperone [Croceibacterium sp. TMG7-5b_MA50]|uniref:phage tail assembly chaperone n=1 Tax=Croceibacterium sp. TMG7-5b_MA50 TaxID=3121290 RepID=UPI0032218E7B